MSALKVDLGKELELTFLLPFSSLLSIRSPLEENTGCYDMMGRCREVVVSKVKATWAWRQVFTNLITSLLLS